MIQTSARSSQGRAAIVAENGLDHEAGPLEPRGHLPDGQGAERQVEAMLGGHCRPRRAK